MDRLSRKPDLKVGIENNNSNQILIKNQWIHSLLKIVIEKPKVSIIERIKKAKSKDKEIVRVVEKIKKARVKVL